MDSSTGSDAGPSSLILNIDPASEESEPLPSASTPPPTKVLSPFHSNPDILEEICDFLTYDDDLEPFDPEDAPVIRHSRQNLLHVALTCRAFLEPGLDRLWRTLDSLFPLLCVLPAFVRSDGTWVLRGVISEAEWARFDSYARRVRRFSYSRDPDTLDIAMHVYFRLAQLHPPPILPNIRHLSCPSTSQTDFLISGICLFLSPSLQSLDFGNISNVEDKLCGTLLHTLHCDGAQMEKIFLKGTGLSLDTLSMVVKFEHLKSLDLVGMGKALNLDILEKIGALPWLVDLVIDFTENETILPLLEKDIGLKDLKTLFITAPVAFIRSFLPRISTTTLETFVSSSPSHPPADKKELLQDVTQRWGQTLRKVALVYQQTQLEAGGPLVIESLPVSALDPLLPLRSLETLRLDGYAMELSDDNILNFVRAWPELTALALPYTPATHPRPSINSLRILAQHLPNLKQVRIPLNTTDSVPTFHSPGVPSAPGRGHKLEQLTVASGSETWELRDLLHFARHVDYLFPRLKGVFAYEGGDAHAREREVSATRWTQVDELIMTYQAVRRETISQLASGV